MEYNMDRWSKKEPATTQTYNAFLSGFIFS